MPQTYLGTFREQQFSISEDGDISSQPLVRRRIRAAQGCKMVTGVFRHPEINIAAYLTDDPLLCNSIRDGIETYSYLACCYLEEARYGPFYEAYKNPRHPKHSKAVSLRSIAETLTLGLLNGLAPYRLASMLGQSTVRTANSIHRFLGRAALLNRWLHTNAENANIVEATRRALFGRAVDMLERATGGLRAVKPGMQAHPEPSTPALLRPGISHIFHDAIVLECPTAPAGFRDCTGTAAQILQRSMRCACNATLPNIRFDPDHRTWLPGGPPMRIDVRVADSCRKRS
jgi:hypothetical protein